MHPDANRWRDAFSCESTKSNIAQDNRNALGDMEAADSHRQKGRSAVVGFALAKCQRVMAQRMKGACS